ncbi:MAG: carboxymuconolactone decarboxylase family protein [Verrucomicrobiota bacterium]|nr:carboxymuconolactone decarboxylase family protein [Verrucomicrobiota bacterium]
MASKTPKTGLPTRFVKFQTQYPALAQALDQLGAAASSAGPLERKTIELVRLAIAVGAREQGAVHSHTRRALEAGASPEEIRHAVLLSITSIGFPNTMAAMSWVDDVLEA